MMMIGRWRRLQTGDSRGSQEREEQRRRGGEEGGDVGMEWLENQSTWLLGRDFGGLQVIRDQVVTVAGQWTCRGRKGLNTVRMTSGAGVISAA